MTKIALTTKYSAYNFGAMLQTYALQRTLNTLGADCAVVDADRIKRPGSASLRTPRDIIDRLFYLMYRRSLTRGYEKFESFMAQMPLTKKYDNYAALQADPPAADVYLSGSDQVWNYTNLSDNYFLRYAPKTAVRASYAASMKDPFFPASYQSLYRDYLQDFDYISVRESSIKDNLNAQLGVEAQVHVDPVFLLTQDQWQAISVAPQLRKPYILCYILYRPAWLNDWLRELHKKTGKSIVLVSYDAFRNVYHNQMIRDAGPQEMLGLIQNADFVISSSFHGAALSIVHKKPFYAVVNPEAPSRLENLLKTFSLEQRMICSPTVSELKPLDYTHTDILLQAERERALEYLRFLADNPPKKTQNLPLPAPLPKGETIQVVADRCTGCKACGSVCSVNAITFRKSPEGFLYPQVAESLCIHCGKCTGVCHALENNLQNTKETTKAFYGWHQAENIRENSSSGGVFSALAENILARGGLVIGAYFDPNTKQVRHGNSDEIPIARFRGSKYVESDLTETYTWIDQALAQNRWVLFCGTPCQCSGLRRRFGSADQLLLVDFFCHGVPSPKIFKDYLEDLEQKNKDTLTDYRFRTKVFGWSQYGITQEFKNKSIQTVGRCEFFFHASMMDNLFLRKSCYTCNKAMYHDADITIGDFWGIINLPEKPDVPNGVSLLLINSSRAEAFLDSVKSALCLHPVPTYYLDYAFQIKSHTSFMARSEKAFAEYSKLGLRAYTNMYYRKKLMLSRIVFYLKRKKLKNSAHPKGKR